MLNARKGSWLHHCQWIRRLTIAPQSPVSILFEYTRLSKDFQFPCGQVMGIKANSTSDINEFLKSEPLSINNGIHDWNIYKMETLPIDRQDMYDPYVFIGIFSKSNILKSEAQVNYHMSSNKICMYGVLRDSSAINFVKSKKTALYDDGFGDEPLDNTNTLESILNFDGNERGVCLVFNSKSNTEALEYISNDPLFKDNLYSQKVF